MKSGAKRGTDPTFTITAIAFKGDGRGSPRVFKKELIGRGTIKSAGLKLFGIPPELDYDRIAIHLGNEQTPVRITETAAQKLAELVDCSPWGFDEEGK